MFKVLWAIIGILLCIVHCFGDEDIFVIKNDNGIVIYSKDIDALNQIEDLSREIKVPQEEVFFFFLKYIEAEQAKVLLMDIFNKGGFSIVADPRLNVIIIQTSYDFDLIDIVVKELDKEDSPVDIRYAGFPRVIKLKNSSSMYMEHLCKLNFSNYGVKFYHSKKSNTLIVVGSFKLYERVLSFVSELDELNAKYGGTTKMFMVPYGVVNALMEW
jgi:type II secretory pathway component GspD/PulD (secretin)